MWEESVPKPAPTGKTRPKREENLVLYAQILLAAAAIAAALALRSVGGAGYEALRRGFIQALQPEQFTFLTQERIFSKFTEQAAEALRTLAAALPESRPAHGKPAKTAPAAVREESYLPGFALQFPLPKGSCTRTSGYGWRTDPMGGQGTEFHYGTDLAAAMGTPVYAAAAGVVRIAGSHKSYGNYLRLLHPAGDETLYAHMQYLFVRAGETVQAGQLLGTVGQTGNATGPHLHFEILHKGLRYDPTQALQAAA